MNVAATLALHPLVTVFLYQNMIIFLPSFVCTQLKFRNDNAFIEYRFGHCNSCKSITATILLTTTSTPTRTRTVTENQTEKKSPTNKQWVITVKVCLKR